MQLIGIERLQARVREVERHLQVLAPFFPPVQLAAVDGRPIGYRHRYDDQNELLLSYLKCIRAVSTLSACILLLEHGYVQETGALCRCIDEFCEDVWFLAVPLGDNGPSEDQLRMVEAFYQEEFVDVDDPVGSSRGRYSVPTEGLCWARSHARSAPAARPSARRPAAKRPRRLPCH